MPPSEHIHVPTAEEAGMLPKALFIFINAHTRGPDTHSSPFCPLMGSLQMLVHVIIFVPDYLHHKPLLQILLSCMLCDKVQMLTPPIPPHSSGLSCKEIQTVGQLIHLHIFHICA